MSLYSLVNKKESGRDSLREYSVELGLRTHRPSPITSSSSVSFDNNSQLFEDQKSRHFFSSLEGSSNGRKKGLLDLSQHGHGTRMSNAFTVDSLSQCSNQPQLGDLRDWWDLPSHSSAAPNYQQKTKNVQISYSADEIYGKASLKKPPKSSEYGNNNKSAKQQSNKHHADPATTFSKSRASSNSQLVDYYNHEDPVDTLKSYVDNCAPRNGDLLMQQELSVSNGKSSNMSKPLQNSSYDYFQHLERKGTTTDKDELFSYLVNNNNTFSTTHSKYDNADQQKVNYRTFEEAMHFYPSDESEDELRSKTQCGKTFQATKPLIKQVYEDLSATTTSKQEPRPLSHDDECCSSKLYGTDSFSKEQFSTPTVAKEYLSHPPPVKAWDSPRAQKKIDVQDFKTVR